MNIENILKNDEKAIFTLRSLFKKYGYTQYKMSKFEEYDFYVRNKDFLMSDNIITFTDTNGKLMALKPDVTLSIIKNSSPQKNCVQKVYYNENVYRISKGTQSFKEIMQVGLECIGDIDRYNIYEVLMLAAKSLRNISPDFMLDISHMGIVSSVISESGIPEELHKNLLKYIQEKNIHEITSLCSSCGADPSKLIKLISAYGTFDKVAPILSELKNDETANMTDEMLQIIKTLEDNGFKDKIHIDFSVVNDMNYYNGFVFKGFIKGISSWILSGGEYSKLMQKMNKNTKAIGFAVYLDMLERLSLSRNDYDVDAILLYDDSCDINAINNAVKLLTSNGKSVMVQKEIPEKVRYKQLLKLQDRGVEIIENNA